MYVTSEVSTIIAPIVVPLYHALRGFSVAKEGADRNRQFWAEVATREGHERRGARQRASNARIASSRASIWSASCGAASSANRSKATACSRRCSGGKRRLALNQAYRYGSSALAAATRKRCMVVR